MLSAAADGDRCAALTGQNADCQTERLCNQGRSACIVDRASQTCEMSAGDVSDFMGHHGNYLICVSTSAEQAGGDKKTLAPRDKGIELWTVDEMNVKGIRLQTGSGQQWRRIRTNGIFDLRITDHRKPTGAKCAPMDN
jgi:hypothetical protein